MTYVSFGQVQGCGLERTRAARLAQAWLISLALGAIGCGSSSQSKQLTLTAPMDGQVLTSADDADSERPGVQFAVEGSSTRVAANTSVDLYIDDAKQEGASTMIDAKGKVEMPGITLPPGAHTIYLKTATGSVSSNKMQKYTLKALAITSPMDGVTLTMNDDEDKNTDGFQLTIKVQTYETDLTQKVSLLVDGKSVDAKMADSSGRVTFSAETLLYGKHTLQATVPDGDNTLQSDSVTMTLQPSCASVTFLQPMPPTTGSSVTLGGAGNCPAKTVDPFTTTVEISTDAGDGRSVDLVVNGQQVASTTVSGSTAKFSGVALTNHTGSNSIVVRVEDSAGHVCPITYPADVFVDCAGTDCTLDGPMPYAFKDSSGTSFYLNRSMVSASGKGFDFEVGSSSKAIGQNISLVIDGKSTAMKATAKGSGSHAVFTAVALDEGAHTIQALCTDSTGNQTSTDSFNWSVDITACDVMISDPMPNAMLLPEDDTDSTAQGTQTVVTSKVTGGDCTGKRAAVCDPSSGIQDSVADFVSYDGTSPLMSTVTLDEQQMMQNLCVEIEDHAGNIGRDSVAVNYRAGAGPMVTIEKPADGTKVNIAGGTGYVADADSNTAACDAEFWVACSELGSEVQLHQDSDTGNVFASGNCAAPDSGDPALPSGYAGRAKITGAFENGNADVMIVATQSVTGSSSKTAIGKSAPITIHGDCTAPDPALMGDPCNSANSNVFNLAGSATSYSEDVAVQDNVSSETVTPTLNVSNTDGTHSSPSLAAGTGPFTFMNVNLGGVGTVTLSATLVDDFGNQATSATCMVEIHSDVPTLSITAPTDAEVFGPNEGCSAGAGNFGVAVMATADTSTNRTATAKVNGGADQNLTVGSNGAISGCVVVPDDGENGGSASTILVHVESTSSHAFVENMVSVHVHKIEITMPTSSQILTVDHNCHPSAGGFGYTVQLALDQALVDNHDSYSIAVGSTTGTSGVLVPSQQTNDCVAFGQQGPVTVVASIDGSSISTSIDVTVATVAPTMPVTLDNPTLPDPASATYRSDQVTANWAKPTTDYPGQLVSYEMRCRALSLADSADANGKATWWQLAQPVTLPSGLDPNASGSTQSAAVTMRVGETNNCMLVGKDAAGQLTPFTASKDMSVPFRQHALVPAGPDVSLVGQSVSGVGDVNGDGIDDVLIGGAGVASLVFGKAGAPSGTADVSFAGSGLFGYSVAGIGDFNGDGRDDFVIGDGTWNNARGRLDVFFGRPSGSPWPASVDMTSSSSGTCGADVCIDHTVDGVTLGIAVSSAGDFNGSGPFDLAAGATGANSGAGQFFVVLGSAYQAHSCGGDGDCRSTESCTTGSCALRSGQSFWGIEMDTSGAVLNPEPGASSTLLQAFKMDGDTTSMNQLGGEFAALGSQDAAAGQDLAVAALGDTNTATQGKVYFLSGRAYTAGTGVQDVPTSQLGVSADGQPFAMATDNGVTGHNDLFGNVVSALGNIYNVSGGANAGAGDIGIERALDNSFYVYPGDNNFSVSDSISVKAGPHDNLGSSIANGIFPAIGSITGDLNNDGKVDFCFGAAYNNNVRPGNVWVWYSDAFANAVSNHQVDFTTGSPTAIPGVDDPNTTDVLGPTGSDIRVVDYAGDINNDGFQDIVVGDPNSGLGGNLNGGAFLLY